MAFTKIEESDVLGKKVSDLPDTPEMSAAELKARFDKVSEEVVIPKFNALVNDLSAEEAADKIGAIVPEGIESEKNIGAVIRAITKITLESWNEKHSHENKSVLNAITDTVKKSYDRLVTLFEKINIISDTVSDDNTLLPTGKAIVAYVKKLGAGDMQAAVYDSNNNGVVDDAEKLGGELPSKYQKVTDKTLETESKTIPGAINELYVLAQNGGKALVGNDFSELTDYSIGDYAIKDNTLYRFIAEKLAGAWDDSVVVATTVEAELQEIIVNFTTAANGIGDAIAAKGVDVPVGTSLLEMPAIIENANLKLISGTCTTVIGAGSTCEAALDSFNNATFGSISSETEKVVSINGGVITALTDLPAGTLKLTVSVKRNNNPSTSTKGTVTFRTYVNTDIVATNNLMTGTYDSGQGHTFTVNIPAMSTGDYIKTMFCIQSSVSEIDRVSYATITSATLKWVM